MPGKKKKGRDEEYIKQILADEEEGKKSKPNCELEKERIAISTIAQEKRKAAQNSHLKREVEMKKGKPLKKKKKNSSRKVNMWTRKKKLKVKKLLKSRTFASWSTFGVVLIFFFFSAKKTARIN